MKKPKLSVIMPVYNAEKFIVAAIDCILNQTMKDFELVIVDDCGNDLSMQIVEKIEDERIKIIRNECNRGISYSRNVGLRAANGEYIALMDDDDIVPLQRFEMEVDFLNKHEEIDIVGGGGMWIDEAGKIISRHEQIICNPKRIKAELLFHDIMQNGSTMMRTNFVRSHQLVYKDGYMGMEDYRFWIECAALGNIANLDEILLYWRRTSGSETSRVEREQQLQRRIKYAELQKDALKLNGFELTAEEINIFTKCFAENKREFISIDDLQKVMLVLKKMIAQAEEKNMENKEELRFVCHRMFALKTENSELWK